MIPDSRARLACALIGALALSGCGTYHVRADNAALQNEPRPQAWSGSIALASDPAGARCAVTRGGAAVTQVTTPAQVTLARGNDPVEVRCSAPGRMDTAVTLRPLRDFGVHHHQPTGPVGTNNNREDIQTGRVRRFFDATVALPPAAFASAAERDAFFNARAAAIRAGWEPQIARAERSRDAMIDSADTLRGYMQQDLAALDRQKAAATIATAARGRR
ncbi:hypothetical protein J5Y09_08940 [Roseomonas sp. PWR1]|uniref:Lipoprotein n=1 Tax=Roseomonas nitratireducens TaxID=2820810 RepID=A0ABS4ARP7_9PROT|nr:hypothetical protein [Neoroseomonas nitratireducens]MBP0464034.1 hypothetical protein [Neoroseomonas nitratireducens]